MWLFKCLISGRKASNRTIYCTWYSNISNHIGFISCMGTSNCCTCWTNCSRFNNVFVYPLDITYRKQGCKTNETITGKTISNLKFQKFYQLFFFKFIRFRYSAVWMMTDELIKTLSIFFMLYLKSCNLNAYKD